MIVVSDTGPLNYAIQIGCTDALPAIFTSVYIPPAVALELRHPRTPEIVLAWMRLPPAWLIERTPIRPMTLPELGPGEGEAIALAAEIDADLLIDDQKAKRIAMGLGVRTIGLLALLRIASERGLVDLLQSLDRLERTSFFAPQELIEAMRREELRRRSS